MTGIFPLGLFRKKRPLSKQRKLFSRTEALESRELLSVDFSVGLSAANMLAVDPDESDLSISDPATQRDQLDLLFADVDDSGLGSGLIGALLFSDV